MLPYFVNANTALMLSVLAALLTGCASKTPTPPAASLQLPPPPSLTTPLPSTTYSLSASENIERWRLRLRATQVMSAPSSTPGPSE